MKKKQRLLFSYVIILIACILVVLSSSFTAWVVEELSLSIEIAPSKQACLYFVSAPSLVLQNSQVTFLVETRNCGNQNFTGETEITIRDPSLNLIDKYETSYTLALLERKQLSVLWYANHPTGIYLATAKAYYDNDTIEVNSSFYLTQEEYIVANRSYINQSISQYVDDIEVSKAEITLHIIPSENVTSEVIEYCKNNQTKLGTPVVCEKASPFVLEKDHYYEITIKYIVDYIHVLAREIPWGIAPLAAPSPAAPAVGAPSVPIQPRPAIDLTLEYPSHITLVQGTNHTFFVRIVNSGDIALHNLSLSLQSEIASRVNPLLVSILEPGSSAMFVVELEIPSDLATGDYWISWKILADEIEKIGGILADVKALEAKEDSERLIEDYSSMIDSLEEEIEKAREEEKNVTAALAMLEEAKYELNISKELHDLRVYEESLEHLEATRKKIGQAAMMLVEASKPAVIIPYSTFIITILIIITLVCYIIYKKMKKKRLEEFRIRKMLHKPRI